MGFLIPPPLIEPILIEVEQIDEANTQFSGGLSGRHETINSTVKVKVSFQAQVVFGNTEQKTEFSQIGADENAGGYLVVRSVDLRNAGIKLKRGDKIIKMGTGADSLDTELYLLHGQNKMGAQFSALGGFALARVFFADRNPG